MEIYLENYQIKGPNLKNLQEELVIPFEVKILYRNFEKTGENEEICGRLKLCFANIQQIQRKELDYDEVLESLIGGDFRLIRAIYSNEWNNKTGNLTKSAYEALNFIHEDKVHGNENFVYIESLEIIGKHRGKGIGIYHLKKVLKHIAKNLNLSFFVMVPHPLQDIWSNNAPPTEWNEKMEYDKLEKNKDIAIEKLRKLYGEIGFNLVKETNLMVCRANNFCEI